MKPNKGNQPMSVLTREDIMEVLDTQIERVSVPEWGGDVFVRGMTGSERDNFEAGIISTSGKDRKIDLANIRAKLCSMCACDEAGKKLFTPSDIKELSKKSALALGKVFKVAQRLSGITNADVNELAEGLAENPTEDSRLD